MRNYNFAACDMSCAECGSTTANDCTACGVGEFLHGDGSCQGIMDHIYDRQP